MLAALLSAPEIALTDDEAKRLAKSAAELQKHFPIPVIDPKWAAVGAFAATCVGIYRPKVQAMRSRKRGHNGGPPLNDAPPSPAPAPQAFIPAADFSGAMFPGVPMPGRPN